ncbi:tetratricopeptide repeat protein [Polynucleobacter sp. MWH-UH19D]|uniref:tetratricopeptide repeat protein n=1 Tax=Polynucleobacter sp. MWH-UH19D TaxID=1855610 RepID=UPI003364DADF
MTVRGSIDDAVVLHRLGKLEDADEIYASVLVKEPFNTQVLSLRGLIAESRGNLSDAIKYFEAANQIRPGDLNICLQLGMLYSANRNFDASNQLYEGISSVYPESIEVLVNHGNNLTKQGRYEDALDKYKKALLLESESARINYNIGVMYLKCMDPDSAVPYLEKATDLDRKYFSAWNNLGVALSQIGDLEAALDAYQKALSIDAQDMEALFNVHSVCLDLNQPESAIESLKNAIKLGNPATTLKFFLAIILNSYGRAAEGNALLQSISDDESIRAEQSSWAYIESRAQDLPLLVGTEIRTFELALYNAKLDGLILEFGVYNGKSIRRLATLASQSIHGFDSFEGIPEAWNDEPKGSYSALGKLPHVPNHVVLHKGWFDETLPIFIEEFRGPIRLLHIDCDLYSSTRTILNLLSKQIQKGTVIVFDEFIGYKTWADDEFKAFIEATEEYHWDYQILSFSFVTKQVALIIK